MRFFWKKNVIWLKYYYTLALKFRICFFFGRHTVICRIVSSTIRHAERVELFWGKIQKYTFIFYPFSTLGYQDTVGSWNHSRWRAKTSLSYRVNNATVDATGNEGISSHGIEPILPEYSGFGTREFKVAVPMMQNSRNCLGSMLHFKSRSVFI